MIRNYNDPEYKKWRKEIYKRDNFTCQWPGCKSHKKLNAHHIKKWSNYPHLRYDVNNGITLCSTHHKSISNMEELYELNFHNILKANGKLR